MPELTKLTVRVLGDVTDLRSKMSKAEKSVEQFGYNMQRTGKTLTAALTLPIAAAGAAATKFASDAAEAANKFEVVMGGSAGRLRDRFEELHDIIPATRAEMEGLTSGVQDLLVPLGIARDEAASMSLAMLELGADIGSFNNVATGQVLEDFKSALAGQSRPLRKYGIDVSQARLETIALENGLLDASGAMTTAARAQAVLIASTQDSTDAIGDSARTAKDAANQFRFFMRNIRALATTVGEQLLPVITPMVNKINESLKAADGVSASMVQWTIAIAGVAAALGPLLIVAGKLVQTFISLRVAGMAALPFFGVGGALVLGLGALATVLIKNKLEAAGFASELDKIREGARKASDEVRALTEQQTLQILGNRRMALQRMEQRQGEIFEAARERTEFAGGRTASEKTLRGRLTGKQEREMEGLDRAIESTKGTIEALERRYIQLSNMTEDMARGAGGTGGALGVLETRLAGRYSPMVEMMARRARAGKMGAPLPTDLSAAGAVSARLTGAGANLEGAGGIGARARVALDEAMAPLEEGFSRVFGQFGPQAMALGSVFDLLKGAMEPLRPVIDSLREPLQILGTLIGQTLAPILEGLTPIIKLVAKAFTIVLQAAGWLIEGFGWIVDKLIGWATDWGDKLQAFGQTMQDNAEAARKSMDATDGFTEALNEATRVLNAPSGFKVALARFNATNAGGGGGGGGGGTGGGSGGAGGGGRPGGPVTQTYNVNIQASPNGDSPESLWQKFKEGAQRAASGGDPDAMALGF